MRREIWGASFPNRMITHATLCLFFLLLPGAVFSQSTGESQEQAWSRSPKAIAFQNDSQWEDNRWQLTDVGPFLSGSIATPNGPTLKGIAIRVGDRQQAAVCFDTAMMRISAAWTGEFLQFDPRRFGLIRHPSAAGEVMFTTPRAAGWAKGDRFQPEPNEFTLPEVENGYTSPGSSIVHLPRDWAAYRGLYTSGQRVVLSYSVSGTDVLESPWYVQAGTHAAFTRSLEIGPSTQTLRMWVADPQSQVTVIGEPSAAITRSPGDAPLLTVEPHDNIVRVKLMITRKDTDADGIRVLRAAGGGVEDLSRMIMDDVPRWPEGLRTEGTTTETGGPYVIDTLTLPFENPYQALLFTSGHDFFSDGTAAVCTVHGDVWVVSGIDRHLKHLRWRRYATGLFQPLGLKIVADKVYVIGRDQITRLHDRNGDGEADYYENFNNDLFITPRTHDFVTCLDTDPEGNFYFIHAKTGVMRLSADGSELVSIADGFRNPNGMAVGPDGTVTAAPQQGTWTPESSLIVVKEGGYYGYGGPRVTPDRLSGWDLPMCFIPRSMDNSGGAQVWVESDRWGPLTGQMLHLSYGQCRLLLTLVEKVDGVFQGGAIKFPTTPSDFESGIMRGRFNPHDGQLYVSGLRGWQTRAVRDGCFQRVRYTGGPLHLPTRAKTYSNGIKLTFSEPLDRKSAEDPGNFLVEQWNYRWSAEYGSPDFSVENPAQQGRDEVPVLSATLMDDGQSIFLEMPGRHPVMQISISWLLSSSEGEPIRGTYAHTINAVPSESIPESQIVRRAQPQRIPKELEQRLQPGLHFQFQSAEPVLSDSRLSRLVALDQPTDKPPTPFLPPGPFSLDVAGTLRTPLSGFYDFKIEGTGQTQFWINDDLTLRQPGQSMTTEPILLHKGHNRIRMAYSGPAKGNARLELWWRGYDFDWEPVPPHVFFHDSGSSELLAAHQRRLGRELFAGSHCNRCHQTNVGEQPMLELTLAPPDLAAVGDRFTPAWLQQWLVSPKSLRPDGQMPTVLGVEDSAHQDAADIAAFLLSQHDTPVEEKPSTIVPPASEPVSGAVLFESLGCIACHHFEASNESDAWGRLSLHFAGAKFRRGALVRFLRSPAKHAPATAMPDFRLTHTEAEALAHFVRAKSTGRLTDQLPMGDVPRGRELFTSSGCQQCHSIGSGSPNRPPQLTWRGTIGRTGCLAPAESSLRDRVPDFALSDEQQHTLLEFIRLDLESLQRTDPIETSARLIEKLQCANCHDRDGRRSHRMLVIAEEGSGKVPEPLPALTWSGEKLQPTWTESLFAGESIFKSRPWIRARMPSFPAYAKALAHGLAAEHAVNPHQQSLLEVDADLAAIGENLTRQTALDCRQCHGIGNQLPRGDKNTKIAEGINFTDIRDRMRRDAYERFMFDPPRYDINTRMIRLSEDGLTTKVKEYFDADAHQQFAAVWHYIQSLPPREETENGTRPRSTGQ